MRTPLNRFVLKCAIALTALALWNNITTQLASASSISVTIKATSFGGSTPVPGSKLFLTVEPSRSPVLELPAPDPDDMDRVLNYQIGDPPTYAATIREENAGQFGLDWQAFENSVNGLQSRVIMRFGNGPPFQSAVAGVNAAGTVEDAIQATGHPGYLLGLDDFEMQEIRVRVDYYFWHPILTGLRAARVDFEIDGTGRVIPEPSSLLLMVILAVASTASRYGKRTNFSAKACPTRFLQVAENEY